MVVLGNGNGRAILASPRNAVDLLAEFKLSGRQEAFEEVVRRYAAMVFGVCLKTTRNPHDAEDATQAVFLNLAVHCRTNDQPIAYVGPWLQKVARRVSLDIRRSRKRRQTREETHAATNGNGNGHVDGGQESVDVEELKVVLNEELHQLPAKYRLPMILHYFGGLSRDEMAKELGCKPSTLGVRIHRGRQMLARRLTERGASPGHLSLGMALTLAVRGAVSDGMIASTSKAAAELMAGNSLAPMISSHVLAFSHGAAGLAMIAKLKTVAAVVVVSALTLVAGAGAVAEVAPLDDLKFQWRQFQLRGIFKIPRFLSPFRAPLAAGEEAGADGAALASAARSVAADAAVQAVMWLGEAPDPADERPRVRPGGASHRSRRGIGTPGRVAAQLLSTVVSSNVSSGSWGASRPSALPDAGAPVRRDLDPTPASAAPVRMASGPRTPPTLPPHRDHRPPTGGVEVAVAGWFAGGAARASGAVTLGHGKPIYPLLPPARMNGTASGAAPMSRGAAPAPVSAPGSSITVGGGPGSRGAVTISRHGLAIDTQVIGERGHGELTHNGGDNIARAVRTGVHAGSKGVYNLNDNRLLIKGDGSTPLASSAGTPARGTISPSTASHGTPAVPTPLASAAPSGPQLSGLEIGHDGDGEFNIGNNLGMGEVSEYGQYGTIGSSLVVRGGEAGTGLLRGSGLIHLRGFFDHNGRVVADGYGQDRTLEFSGFKYVGNNFDNPARGGANGWFARDHGKLVLPNLRVRKGTGTYTWGEDPSDPSIDLVNSVRATIHDAAHDGPVRISLLSKDHGDVPALPQGHTFIGVWKFEDGGLGHGAVDLLVRYDDGLASELRLDENVLKLWRYHDGEWIRINDATFTRDVELNLIGGRAEGMEYFAVSAPEPATAAVLLLGGAGLLFRRRRRDGRAR